ncbi:muscarinic acetylcholine receptor M1-like [Ostrea edulis]|uniref:muscarinic acetylcholine receptor M1-like n=1 Tax=Ostrea edulis TaxID=37623 RepID=UPI0024AFA46C|nr:muscarinic acetylcholine receptor M1-like [Ostrea edulis]XP_048730240.2 muscarinic acetylcholine receptor M1-like [Ostrea edulis]XP_055996167.1 muscarinic acetylcholine receptor M1-like [Ostrea edulis]XP_055996168.1 muscarinic acetylcholine receptor M1-like [Ostrea edulis]XP_055996169.1 muscarinic acetylcholine receptor M1-like [Ostrea edulis]
MAGQLTTTSAPAVSTWLVDVNTTLCDNCTNTNVTVAAPYSPPHSLWLTILLGVLVAFIVLITVAGNILVLLSFALERTIRQPTNYFIASLAVSDLLIGTFSMPCFTLYLLLGYWPLGELVCDLWLSLDWTVCLASQYTVFFITVDRFFSVKIPAKYRTWRTEKKVIIMISLTWIFPTLIFFTSIVGWQYFVGERTVQPDQCEVQFMSDPLFTFLLTIGYYWTTLVVMIGLYGAIYYVALTLQRKAEAKHKKMTTAMELSKNKGASKSIRITSTTGSNTLGTENNNGRSMRADESTSFTKAPEEDRSSSPVFESDEENNSSQGACGLSTTHFKNPDVDDDEQTCFVNSAVQTDTTYRPSLKGMLGMSFNHVSKIAFTITGTSGSETETDGNEDINATKALIEEAPPSYDEVIPETYEKVSKQTDKLLENDLLQGCKYIEEDSLKNLTSNENLKIYPDGSISFDATTDERCSPVWKRREGRYLPIPNTEGSSNTISTNAEGDPNHANTEEGKSTKNPSNGTSALHSLDINHEMEGNSDNDANKEKPSLMSPLHNLVQTMRERRKRSKRTRQKVNSRSENRARKALRTITFILGAYILCWTPYHIMVLIIGVCDDGWNCVNMKLYQFTYWLCYLNSPINPFCYALANQQFKKTFLRILKLDCHKT